MYFPLMCESFPFNEQDFINEFALHTELEGIRKKCSQKKEAALKANQPSIVKECTALLETLDTYQNDFHVFLENFRKKTEPLSDEDQIFKGDPANSKNTYSLLANDCNHWMGKIIRLKNSTAILRQQIKWLPDLTNVAVFSTEQEKKLEKIQAYIYKNFLTVLQSFYREMIFAANHNFPLLEMQLAELYKVRALLNHIRSEITALSNFDCKEDKENFLNNLNLQLEILKSNLEVCQDRNRALEAFESNSRRQETVRHYISDRTPLFSKKPDHATSREIAAEFEQLKLALKVILQENVIANKQQALKDLIKLYPGWGISKLYSYLFHENHFGYYDAENKEFVELYSRISKLEIYGLKLFEAKHDAASKLYGQMTLDLVEDLRYKTREFFSNKSVGLSQADKKKFYHEFSSLLLTHLDLVKTHRHYLRKKITNIIKGMLLLGSIIGLPLYGLIAGRNPFKLFHEHRTRREELVDDLSTFVKKRAGGL